MDIDQSGVNDFIFSTGQAVQSLNILSVITSSYYYISLTYSNDPPYLSDSCFLTSEQTITVNENSSINVTPELTCSTTGITSITYSISKYETFDLPSWISIDSNQLNILSWI